MTADLRPIAGNGVLARYGELVVLSSAPDDGHEVINQVLAAHLQVANTNPDGWALADAISNVLAAAPVALDVVTVGPTHGAQGVSVFGTASVTVQTGDGELRIGLGGIRQGARAALPGELTSLRAVVGPDENGPAGEFPWTEHGVIQAAGVVFGTAVSAAAPDAPAQPAPEPPLPPLEPPLEPPLPPLDAPAEPLVEAVTAPEEPLPSAFSPAHAAPDAPAADEPAEQVTLDKPTAADQPTQVQPAQEPAPEGVQVLGVYCPSGHFGDPAAQFCATCGAPMPSQPSMLYPGVRPPLGVLVLEDGSVHSLDKDYVIGRDPQRDADVAAGSAYPLRIDDPDSALSRVHARIHLDNWTVTAVDLDSANGTGIWQPGDAQWTQLPAHQPVALRSGAQLGLGRSQVRYDSRPMG